MYRNPLECTLKNQLNRNLDLIMIFSKKVLKRFIHPYFRVLDYNANWKLSKYEVNKMLNGQELQIIDIGARNFSLSELDGFRTLCDYIAFDADEQEALRLRKDKQGKGFARFRVIPFYVGNKVGVRDFHIYNSPGLSSSLYPDKYYLEAFSNSSEYVIKKTVSVHESTLDKITLHYSLNPDFIKLDTQGTELDILKNADNATKECMMIESETEMIPMYSGQSLFHDVSSFLYKKGFQLLYLNRVFGQKKYSKKSCRGQLIFADALYGITIEKALTLPIEKQLKYCCLLINYGLIDSAIELHDSNPLISKKSRAITEYLKKYRTEVKFNSLIKTICTGCINKFVIWLLSIIKTNGLHVDSDRSWNIR